MFCEGNILALKLIFATIYALLCHALDCCLKMYFFYNSESSTLPHMNLKVNEPKKFHQTSRIYSDSSLLEEML